MILKGLKRKEAVSFQRGITDITRPSGHTVLVPRPAGLGAALNFDRFFTAFDIFSRFFTVFHQRRWISRPFFCPKSR